ncbi:hypothetical protein FLA_1165 [Filimonas lacunae]|nr:hypothetical protein FLA_1165 [Filimonas lacunae]
MEQNGVFRLKKTLGTVIFHANAIQGNSFLCSINNPEPLRNNPDKA